MDTTIQQLQKRELLFIGYYLLFILFFLFELIKLNSHPIQSTPFRREQFAYSLNISLLKDRHRFGWVNFIIL